MSEKVFAFDCVAASGKFAGKNITILKEKDNENISVKIGDKEINNSITAIQVIFQVDEPIKLILNMYEDD